jgi:hypothetical protein
MRILKYKEMEHEDMDGFIWLRIECSGSGFCEHSNEPLDYTEGGEFLDT